MNCPAHCSSTKRAAPTATCRSATPSRGSSTATSRPARCTACCACVHITQDDAHIFCTEEQIEDEVIRCLDFGFAIYDRFGFEPRLELSTRPDERIGRGAMWDHAEAALLNALEKRGLAYELNQGDGAFYGPKIDLHMTDSIGRSWQLGTVQLDYIMPERFELTYTGADNAEHRPVMIHRALMGSFERFIGILIEHYAGEFPLWLAPVQADRAAGRRPPSGLRARGAGRAGRSARRSTSARSRSGARSARPSCARCPTCWSWATGRRRAARCRCAATARGTSAWWDSASWASR